LSLDYEPTVAGAAADGQAGSLDEVTPDPDRMRYLVVSPDAQKNNAALTLLP
jgi:hypothetical protein